MFSITGGELVVRMLQKDLVFLGRWKNIQDLEDVNLCDFLRYSKIWQLQVIEEEISIVKLGCKMRRDEKQRRMLFSQYMLINTHSTFMYFD